MIHHKIFLGQNLIKSVELRFHENQLGYEFTCNIKLLRLSPSLIEAKVLFVFFRKVTRPKSRAT